MPELLKRLGKLRGFTLNWMRYNPTAQAAGHKMARFNLHSVVRGFSSSASSTLGQYLLAILATVVALLVRWAIDPYFGILSELTPLYPAIAFSAFYLGIGPATACTMLGFAGVNYWFMLPRNAFSLAQPGYLFMMFFYLVVAALLIALAEAHRRSLRRAQDAEQSLRQSNRRFRQLAENITSVFWVTEWPSREIAYVSPAVQQVAGITPEQLRADPLAWIKRIDDEDRIRADAAFQQSLTSGAFDVEYRLLMPNGGFKWIHDRGFPVKNELGQVYRILGIAEDISQRKQSEEALRKSEERAEIAQKAAHFGIWEWNLETGEVIWSPEEEALYGLEPGTFSGDIEQWRRMVNPADLANVEKVLQHAIDTLTEYHVEFRITRADGAVRWVESFGQVFYDEKGKAQRIVGVNADITDRKDIEDSLRKSEAELRKAHDELEQKVEERTHQLAETVEALQSEMQVRERTEQQLRELSARLLRLQDEERRRVARDLHDSTGQTLTALKMSLASLEVLVAGIPNAPKLLSDLDALADQALQEIRTTSHLLHPPLLDEVGFSSAAQWYVDGFAKRSGFQTKLELSAVRLTKEAELVFFRVMQESLTNVLRHSGSTAVDIILTAEGENAVLSIRDYGKGIPSEKLNSFHETGAGVGVGLGGMKQRVRELSGHLRVESANGAGTCVTATLPLAKAQQPTNAPDDTVSQAAPAA